MVSVVQWGFYFISINRSLTSSRTSGLEGVLCGAQAQLHRLAVRAWAADPGGIWNNVSLRYQQTKKCHDHVKQIVESSSLGHASRYQHPNVYIFSVNQVLMVMQVHTDRISKTSHFLGVSRTQLF